MRLCLNFGGILLPNNSYAFNVVIKPASAFSYKKWSEFVNVSILLCGYGTPPVDIPILTDPNLLQVVVQLYSYYKAKCTGRPARRKDYCRLVQNENPCQNCFENLASMVQNYENGL